MTQFREMYENRNLFIASKKIFRYNKNKIQRETNNNFSS